MVGLAGMVKKTGQAHRACPVFSIAKTPWLLLTGSLFGRLEGVDFYVDALDLKFFVRSEIAQTGAPLVGRSRIC
jgi:hypothetical protein